MGNKGFLEKSWRKYRTVPVFFLTILVAGCQAASRTENLPIKENLPEETAAEAAPRYFSDTRPEDCFLCGDGKGSLLPLYRGQENLGIINLNTFDLAPVTLNRYDDFGKLIEKSADGISTHITNTGEDGFFLSVTADTDRGYARGYLSFSQAEILDIEKAASHLCSECLNRVMDNCWSEIPLGMGVIDFSNGGIRLFEENILAFTFGDYYISCTGNSDEEDKRNMNLLIFYCPERYQD